MSKELTNRQKEILTFIENFIYDNGYPPSYREIGKEFDIASTFGVKRHIDALIKKGFLASESNTNRTLSLVGGNTTAKSDSVIEIPIVGRVAAGYPILAEENIEDTIVVGSQLVKSKNPLFGLKVRGDSMINAGILEGDVVFVSKVNDARNGDIIIAFWNNEATVKRYEKKGNTINLIPENENFSIITIKNQKDFSIIGKVVGVYRYYN